MQGRELTAAEIKSKVREVCEVVKGKSHNEVTLVLQYYEYDVEQAVQAFTEDGGKTALEAWNFTGSKKVTKKKKKKNKKSKAGGHTEEDEKAVAGSQVNGEAEANGTTGGTSSAGSSHYSSLDNVSNNGDTAGTTTTHQQGTNQMSSDETHRHEANNSDSPPTDKPKTKQPQLKAYQQKSRHSDGGRRRGRTASERFAGHDRPPSPLDPPVHKKPTHHNLEKSQQQLQKHVLDISRIQRSMLEQIEENCKVIKKGFEQLQEALIKRESELIYTMDQVRNDIKGQLNRRLKDGEALRIRSVNAVKLSEHEINVVRNDIRAFINDKKHEDLKRASKLHFALDAYMKDIESFGTSRSSSMAHNGPCNTDSNSVAASNNEGKSTSCNAETQTDSTADSLHRSQSHTEDKPQPRIYQGDKQVTDHNQHTQYYNRSNIYSHPRGGGRGRGANRDQNGHDRNHGRYDRRQNSYEKGHTYERSQSTYERTNNGGNKRADYARQTSENVRYNNRRPENDRRNDERRYGDHRQDKRGAASSTSGRFNSAGGMVTYENSMLRTNNNKENTAVHRGSNNESNSNHSGHTENSTSHRSSNYNRNSRQHHEHSHNRDDKHSHHGAHSENNVNHGINNEHVQHNNSNNGVAYNPGSPVSSNDKSGSPHYYTKDYEARQRLGSPNKALPRQSNAQSRNKGKSHAAEIEEQKEVESPAPAEQETDWATLCEIEEQSQYT